MVHWWVLVHCGPTWLPHQLDEPKYEWWSTESLNGHTGPIWPTTSLFLLPPIQETKNSQPYDIGTYHTIFFTLMMSLDFLSMMIGFFKLGQPRITQHPNFGFCPCYKTEEHERRVSTYKVHKTQEGCKQSQTLVMNFFLPKNRWILYSFV